MALPPYEMMLRGSFARTEVAARHEARTPFRPEQLRARIADEWEARVADAARGGVHLTNGRLLRLEHAAERSGSLTLHLGDTTYADFLATNCDPVRRRDLDPGELANPLGTSALVLASDGLCVLGLRGGAVLLHQGHIHTIGGMFEAVDLVDGRVDPAGSILREVEEELGVEESDLDAVVCRGVMRDLDNLQPELMFEITTKLDAAAIEERWRTAPSRDEHRELVFVQDDAPAIEAYLRTEVPMAPQARAALELRAGA